MDLPALRQTLAEVNWPGFASAALLLTGLTFVNAWRWGFVLRALAAGVPFNFRVSNCFIGQFFNQTLPSTIGGDAIRIWLLTRTEMSLRTAANSVLIDRFAGLFALLLIALAGLPWLAELHASEAAIASVAGAASIGLIAIGVLLVLDRLPTRLLHLRPVAAAATLSSDARASMLNRRTGPVVVGIAISVQMGVSVVVWMIAQSLGASLTLANCAVLVPLVMVVSAIPISVAGWGVREGAMVAAFALAGVQTEDAFAISLLFGLAAIVSGLPGGLLWLRTRKAREVVAARSQ